MTDDAKTTCQTCRGEGYRRIVCSLCGGSGLAYAGHRPRYGHRCVRCNGEGTWEERCPDCGQLCIGCGNPFYGSPRDLYCFSCRLSLNPFLQCEMLPQRPPITSSSGMTAKEFWSAAASSMMAPSCKKLSTQSPLDSAPENEGS
jgi:hypothetical protein